MMTTGTLRVIRITSKIYKTSFVNPKKVTSLKVFFFPKEYFYDNLMKHCLSLLTKKRGWKEGAWAPIITGLARIVATRNLHKV